ncbi:MAG: formyltransferase family protein [Nanoarchaeota archaeon]|nr:formyltransferase family protein [Nanoarchaeota archaeon]
MSKDYQLLHDPAKGPMRTVVFASGSGTNFEQAIIESRMPGSNFSIDLLVTDKEFKKSKSGEEKRVIGAINYAQQYRIPHRFINGFRECGSWAEAQKSVQGMREYQMKSEIFNLKFLDIIQSFENEAGITFDLAVLAGYMRFFQGALLRRFNGHAVNMHPAELNKFTPDGLRKYVGENAVYDALVAGETRTRSSMILVDHSVDGGAILASGPWLNYNGERPITSDLADEHQDIQKRASDWPTERFTLREIAHGNFALSTIKFHFDGNPVVLYKGNKMPYRGFELD